MPCPTSFDRVCYPKAVISCHARRCQPCVLTKGGDVMPRPTSSDCVCCPKAVMSCHAQHCHRESFPRAVMICYARCYRPCVLSKGDDVMPRPMLPTVRAVQLRCCHAMPDIVRPCVQSKGDNVMQHMTSSNHACSPRAVMSCHARRRLTIYAVQGR